eukprot:Phypoly_transcript_01065.p1 GENE.Phypoly_transcript_01065~~Phypoly_transcript_01065.p1  ORF type:complete len:971 (+),score=137.37 Phypoly_transcript_01065:1-2913(+)
MSSRAHITNTPENINFVDSLLQQTLAVHDNVRKPAADQVAALEGTPGYATLLCDIICARERFPTDNRLLAVISLKNVAHQFWRPKTTNVVEDQEKQYLRGKLLVMLDEPEDKVGIQLAIVISKIARIDFPQYWPDILDKLLMLTKDERTIVKQRSLLTLQHVTSVLCSRRLMGNRHQFQQYAPTLFKYVSELWNQYTEVMIQHFYQFATNKTQETVLALTNYAVMAALCMKVLRRTLEHGIPSFHQSREVTTFLGTCLERLKLFDDFRNTGQLIDPLAPAMEQLIILHQKLLLRVQHAQPIPFAPFLLPTLQYFYNLLKTPFSHRPPPIPQAQINAMIFTKNVVTNATYNDANRNTPRPVHHHHSAGSSDSLLTPFDEAARMVAEFFTEQMIKDLAQVLISQYFVLSSEELKDWNDNPEEFIRELEADAWRFSRKPCAENLFMTLLQQNEQTVTQLVVDFLQHVLKEPLTSDGAFLLREAIYNAIGLGQYELSLTINCGDLYNNIFLAELQNPDPRGKILRRRIAWLLGNWVSNIKDEMRGSVYRTLVQLMVDPDLAVALTSAEALRSLVDDVHFHVEQFKEFVDPTIAAVFRILGACQDSDTQLRVLRVISVMIEQLGEHVKHHATNIIQSLGALWTVSCNMQLNLLKSSIVRTLTSLVHAIGSDPSAQSAHTAILPVVNYSSHYNSADSVYLLEDGLLLWLAVLSHANASSPALLSLFPHLPEILDNTLEHLEVCMKILETYLLLGMTEFMHLHAASVADTFLKLIGNVSDEGTMFVLRALETLITLFPNESPPLLENVLRKILTLIFSNNETDVAITQYLSIFARIALQNVAFFLAFFDRVLQNSGQNMLPAFLTKWMDKIDNMGQARMRKLSGLGFSSLLVATGPRAGDILQGLQMIVSAMIGLIPDTDASPEDSYELGTFDNEASTSGSAAERQLHTVRSAKQGLKRQTIKRKRIPVKKVNTPHI